MRQYRKGTGCSGLDWHSEAGRGRKMAAIRDRRSQCLQSAVPLEGAAVATTIHAMRRRRALFAAIRVRSSKPPALGDIYAHVEAELRSEVPAFTKSLAPGIGLAESPANESFGLHRCHLIADGLVRSRTEGRTDTAGRLDCVLACWADARLDIERPYLNPGSQDVYEALRSPIESKATIASSAEREQTIQPAACLEVAVVKSGARLARETIWDG